MKRYNEINVFIALVDVVIWTEKDEIEMSTNISTLLDNFLNYRNNVLAKKMLHDTALLITKTDFGYCMNIN